jgi:tRNA G26 N,N-dimethylase Trm1
MWSGPIHDSGFITRVLEHLESNQEKYGTFPRMKGMLTVAQEVRALELTAEPITDTRTGN